MTKLDQQAYWNGRASSWGNYSEPLIPSEPEINFQREHIVPDGDTLVLGATRELCTMAREISGSVTAVDFASDVIEALRVEGVDYRCEDWIAFLQAQSDQFDTILTDGGLVCLAFPETWKQIADLIHERLRSGGVFSARIYETLPEPPKPTYDNPMLGRFVTSMGGAIGPTWMIHPEHGDYADYDMHYAFPPESEVLRLFGSVFGKLALIGKFVPSYEEGRRFVSYAWQRG